MIHGDNVRIEVVPSSAPAPIDDEFSALRARLEAISLGGLADAADALLGDDAVRVSAMLTVWELHGCGQLPRVTPGCWTALTAFGLGPPSGPAPRALDGLLAGVHAEAQSLLDALAECRDRADRVSPGPIHEPESGNPAIELWRRRLAAAVVDFWAQTAELFAAVRPSVLVGDHAEVCRMIGLARSRLREVAERIQVLADGVSGRRPTPAPSADDVLSATISPEAPAVADSALFRPQSARVTAAAPAAEFHEWAPIAFLAASTTLALSVLLFILLG